MQVIYMPKDTRVEAFGKGLESAAGSIAGAQIKKMDEEKAAKRFTEQLDQTVQAKLRILDAQNEDQRDMLTQEYLNKLKILDKQIKANKSLKEMDVESRRALAELSGKIQKEINEATIAQRERASRRAARTQEKVAGMRIGAQKEMQTQELASREWIASEKNQALLAAARESAQKGDAKKALERYKAYTKNVLDALNLKDKNARDTALKVLNLLAPVVLGADVTVTPPTSGFLGFGAKPGTASIGASPLAGEDFTTIDIGP